MLHRRYLRSALRSAGTNLTRPDVVAFIGQQASQALLAGVLAAAHYALHRRDRRQFLALWAISWTAVSLARVFNLVEAATAPVPGLLVPPSRLFAILNDWLGFLAIAALGSGTIAFDRGQAVRPRTLATIALAALGLGVFTAFGGADAAFPWRWPVRTGLAAAGCFFAAPLIWRGGPHRDGARSVAVAVGCFGLPMAGYAWSTAAGDATTPGRTLDRFVAIGHFDTVLMAAMALAMFVWLYFRERATADAAVIREQQLRSEIEGREARFRSILDQVPDALAVLEPDGRYKLDLRPGRHFLGIPPDSLVGRSVLELVHPQDRERTSEAIATLASHPGATVTVEIRIRHADGRWLTVECAGCNCADVPSLEGILVVARDVTESRALHRRVASAERLETVGRLAGGVAHDFNNLLTIVRGNAALLAGRIPTTRAEHGWAVEIGQAALKGAHLTQHLLAFARRQPVEPKVFDLNRMVGDLLPILRRLVGEPVELVWTAAPEPCPVRADPHQIEQVVINLCANARDAMPSGGRLAISTRLIGDGTVELDVVDGGSGMSEEIRARAFEPFFTTKAQGAGAGLGLATSYGIVAQAGGTITLESEPGQGTTATIVLPLSTEPPTATAKPIPVEPVGECSGVVLVVEDEPAVRAVAARSLRSAGFEVVEAQDGVEAMERLAAGPAPVCIVTDVVMPRLSGDLLANQVWETDPDLPVLFTSGYAREFQPVRESRSAFLQKPYEHEELVRAVAVLLATARQARPGEPTAGSPSG